MRVLHFSTFAGVGGAAIAAQRISDALVTKGVDSAVVARSAARGLQAGNGLTLFPQHKQVTHRIERVLDRALSLASNPGSRFSYSPGWIPSGANAVLDSIEFDVLHLHWVAWGGLGVSELSKALARPVVWTLHDMWPMTGGCHYAVSCDSFATGCGKCPILRSRRELDYSSYASRTKALAVERARQLIAVAPTKWMQREAQRSSVFRNTPVEVIPNPVDLSAFRRIPRQDARARLGLPSDCQIALAVAVDFRNPYKGTNVLRAVHALLTKRHGDEYLLLTAGGSRAASSRAFGAQHRPLGFLESKEDLALAYSAADVSIVPSSAESFGQVSAESIACGTPVVAFSNTGVADLVSDGSTGRLVEPECGAHGLADAVSSLFTADQLDEGVRRELLSQLAPTAVAERYLDVYEKLALRST